MRVRTVVLDDRRRARRMFKLRLVFMTFSCLACRGPAVAPDLVAVAGERPWEQSRICRVRRWGFPVLPRVHAIGSPTAPEIWGCRETASRPDHAAAFEPAVKKF